MTYAVIEVARLHEISGGHPALDETIRSGAVRLVVNTPSPTPGAVRDAAAIRRLAVEEGILCLTSVDTAVAAAASLDPGVRARMADVRSLDEWLAVRAQEPGRVGGSGALSLHP